MTTEQPHTPRRGVYLLPNLFTTATLFGGFYAIIAAIQADFTAAAIAIIAAGFADSMDGRIARLTNTQSDFGKEYDSLCDMIAFGLATAVVVYIWSLSYWAEYKWLGGKLGWVAAFTYTACAALRLARFNVSAALSGGKGDFHGLPSPAAAGVVICYVWASHDLGLAGDVMVLPSLIDVAGRQAAAMCKPINDLRASGAYRRHTAFALTQRLLTQAWERVGGPAAGRLQ